MDYGGGRPGLLSESNLAGALGRPYHGYHRFLYQKCAALLHGVATSHAFLDGNKRTAWLVTFILISRCGYVLDVEDDEPIDDVVVNVVDRQMSQAHLETWFKDRLVKED